jgi:hypothetical protein
VEYFTLFSIIRLYALLFVGRLMSYLHYFCLFVCKGVQHTYCVVHLFCFSLSCVTCLASFSRQVSNDSSTSWREDGTFWWVINDIYCVLDQHGLVLVWGIVTIPVSKQDATRLNFFNVFVICTWGVYFSSVRYDFRIKRMFGSSLPPVVCRKTHVLFTLFVFVCAVSS